MQVGSIQNNIQIALLAKTLSMEKMAGQLLVDGLAQAAELQASLNASDKIPTHPGSLDTLA